MLIDAVGVMVSLIFSVDLLFIQFLDFYLIF